MYNYVITRVSCRAVGRYCFITGAFLGGAGGLLLGMMEREVVSILGGAFLGMLAGVALGVLGCVSAVIYNVLASIWGGIPLGLEAIPYLQQEDTCKDTMPEQQSLFPGE